MWLVALSFLSYHEERTEKIGYHSAIDVSINSNSCDALIFHEIFANYRKSLVMDPLASVRRRLDSFNPKNDYFAY